MKQEKPYSHNYGFTHPDVVPQVVAAIPSGLCGLVLDVGCSDGESTELLSELLPHAWVYGSDKNRNRIKKALGARTVSGNFFVDDAYDSRVSNGAFDVVCCNNNIYYALDRMSDEQAFSVLEELLRVRSREGHLIISGFDDSGDYDVILIAGKNVTFNSSSIRGRRIDSLLGCSDLY